MEASDELFAAMSEIDSEDASPSPLASSEGVGMEKGEVNQESDAMAAEGSLNGNASRPVRPSSSRRRWGEWLCWILCTLLLLFGLTGWNPWRGNRATPVAQSGQAVAPEKQLRTKSIEAIQAGDRVLARDPETGSTDIKRVVEVYRRTSDHVRIVQIRSSEGALQELRTTDEHPFWVPDAGWIDAGQLQAGQSLPQQDGSLAHVVSTRRESHPEGVPVYNFQTEGYHTYFASQVSGNQAILVHNDCQKKSNGSGSLVPRKGTVTVKGAAYRKEIDFANELAAKGYDVVVRGKDAAGADYLVSGVPWEYKQLNAPTINAVRQNIGDAVKQAQRVFIDGRKAGLTHTDAIRAVNQQVYAGRMRGAQEVRVLTTTGEYVWRP